MNFIIDFSCGVLYISVSEGKHSAKIPGMWDNAEYDTKQ